MLPLRIILKHAEQRLTSGPQPERARRDAELLLCHALGRDRAWLLAHTNNGIEVEQGERYDALLIRRATGEPIQYITGETEFYGLPFLITPDVLIPRPETEQLVEKVIELAVSLQSPRIVDVGTGSGAIAVSLADALKGHDFSRAETQQNDVGALVDVGTGSGAISVSLAHALKGHDFSRAETQQNDVGALAPAGRPSTTITATDLSAPALTIARENATRNQTTLRFLQGDLLTPVADEQFEIVVSNPPYVPDPDRPTLAVEVRDHEPALALFAGQDGLDIYRRLIPQAFAHLVPGGFLVLEIVYNQSPAIHDLLAVSGFQNIEFLPDLQQIPRVAVAQRP